MMLLQTVAMMHLTAIASMGLRVAGMTYLPTEGQMCLRVVRGTPLRAGHAAVRQIPTEPATLLAMVPEDGTAKAPRVSLMTPSTMAHAAKTAHLPDGAMLHGQGRSADSEALPEALLVATETFLSASNSPFLQIPEAGLPMPATMAPVAVLGGVPPHQGALVRMGLVPATLPDLAVELAPMTPDTGDLLLRAQGHPAAGSEARPALIL